MEIITDKRKLLPMVLKACEGKICLPDFQRDFVWPPDAIADLLRSMLRRYFVGSLLLLRCDPNDPPFAPCLLYGAKSSTTTLIPDELLLDGQQRVTSLVYAFNAPDLPLKNTKYRRWFFVDLGLLGKDPDDEEIVLERAVRDLEGLLELETQFKRRIVPCTVLFRATDFYDWLYKFEEWIEQNEPDKREFKKEWHIRWTDVVNGLQSFEVPVVEVPRISNENHKDLGQVCAIFEKLNSTGVELSVYDLMTARLYRSKIKLHDLWNEACDKNPRLAKWSGGNANANKFGVLVLRTLALLRNLDPKPRILIDLEPKDFETDWKRAAKAIDRALELIELTGKDGFGVFQHDWLPGYALVPILGALRTIIEDKKLGEKERAELRQWYWSCVFLERYSSAVESKSRKDYADFLGYWTEGKNKPAVFEEAQRVIGNPSYTIRTSASNASSIYCGVFCLLAKQGARDWTLGENITLQELQDHHIFPREYLNRHGIQDRMPVNTILNRTLISATTNNKIRAKAPGDYLVHTDVFPSGPRPQILEPHFINDEARGLMKKADGLLGDGEVGQLYKSFCTVREQQILDVVRRECGVVTAEKAATS
jgi:hypothetical protein